MYAGRFTNTCSDLFLIRKISRTVENIDVNFNKITIADLECFIHCHHYIGPKSRKWIKNKS